MLKRFLEDESGATAIEYGLVAALIAVSLIVSTRLMGADLSSNFDAVSTEVSGAGSSYLDD